MVNTDEKSGSRITGFWNKQSKGGKAAIGIVGVVIVGLILIIVISGMSSPLDNTPVTLAPAVNFTDNSITFSYPGDMSNFDFTNTSDLGMIDVAKLSNQNVLILVSNYPSLKNAPLRRNLSVSMDKENSDSILSISDEINPNGILVSKYIAKFGTGDGTQLINYYLFFLDKRGIVYKITVYGDVRNNSQINETATLVFNSLH